MLLSLRRRGQLLLATCVLAGVFVGSGCGMLVERAEAPSAFAAPAWERGSSAVAARPPGRAASGSRTAVAAGSSGRAASGSRTATTRSQAGEKSTMSRTGSPQRADRHHKAGKYGRHQRGTGRRGKDE